jgi:hypothetical protein
MQYGRARNETDEMVRKKSATRVRVRHKDFSQHSDFLNYVTYSAAAHVHCAVAGQLQEIMQNSVRNLFPSNSRSSCFVRYECAQFFA